MLRCENMPQLKKSNLRLGENAQSLIKIFYGSQHYRYMINESEIEQKTPSSVEGVINGGNALNHK
ncbi:hypothetical protein BtSCAC15_28015 [Bacillus thuringiensis]|nr:hypothetical protein BtSCAC15_28015 [Bacillus thuringiensis]